MRAAMTLPAAPAPTITVSAWVTSALLGLLGLFARARVHPVVFDFLFDGVLLAHLRAAGLRASGSPARGWASHTRAPTNVARRERARTALAREVRMDGIRG
jgi:hypothetical protein